MFKKKLIGTEKIKKIIPVKIKDNVIISKQLKYKCVLPSGFKLIKQSHYDKKEIYTEFLALDGSKRLMVMIYMADGSDFDSGKEEFHAQAILKEIIRGSYLNFDDSNFSYCNFMGLPCAHYAGVTDSKFDEYQNAYVERYTYVAPYCKIDFMVMCGERQVFEVERIFDCFQKL